MLKSKKIFLAVLSLILIVSCISSTLCFADEAYYYENEENGNYILIDDGASLLSSDEEDALYDIMYSVSAYGHVAFVTITKDDYSTVEEYADEYYHYVFGKESGTMLLIDMDKRKICIFSDGEIYKTVNRDYSDIITDNIYKYASDKDYYRCAYEGFSQILTLLEGGRIAQPMKYICNALLSLIIAMLLIYLYVRLASSPTKASDSQLMEGLAHYCNFSDFHTVKTGSSKRYSPRSSGSGGSGGSSGGGGGSSGGGGSHSF